MAVQQKQIVVTCNYEARRRGLRKLQLVKDAKQICPDVVIVLGEDIGRFRDASKRLYQFLRSFSWNDRAERLGFDEVWLDVTDMVEYNIPLLNLNDMSNSFFILEKDDPLKGFVFDATCYAGPTFPETSSCNGRLTDRENLALRLLLGSHLASYIRNELEKETGYTSTVGISTSKLLSKLVGNLHKPKNQTTLIPPYICQDGQTGNVETFIDNFEVGKVPGIGFKLAQKVRQHVLQHAPDFETGLVYGATKEDVTVKDARLAPGMGPATLEKLLGGPGSPNGIGIKIWSLLHGVDETEVNHAKTVPSQIGIEDSYIRLDTLPEVSKELKTLSCSLIERMRVDLVIEIDDDDPTHVETASTLDKRTQKAKVARKWLAHPKTLRLSTRPRLPLNPDGTRSRSFKRISHSAPLPNFVFSLTDSVDTLSERLVREVLINMFRRLHPEKSGWNLSLVNVAVTSMAETGGESKTASGRNISSMFKRQESVHQEFRIQETKALTKPSAQPTPSQHYEPCTETLPDDVDENSWIEEEGDGSDERCGSCGMLVPSFAMNAHMRFHQLGD